LELLQRDGKDLDRLGALVDLLNAGSVPVPAVQTDDAPGISIEGKESSAVNVSIGVTILGSIIRAMGGSDLGLAVNYNRARTVTFEYTSVLEDRVDRLRLEQFINTSKIKPENSSGFVEKLIDDEVYVITSTLKSKKFIVNALAEDGTSLDLNVPVIKAAVGGNVKVQAEGGLSGKVSYEGPVPLVFAIQAAQLVFNEDGTFLTTEQLTPGAAAVRGVTRTGATAAAAPQRQPVFLEVPGAFVRLSD
jgi:hypothetical protein